ncbi:transcriptional regulator, TetR family [Clostridium acidisoli DSM 12555]|jgi:AcrR family transcriptional regulator|uniref:Transcriptional regulator, TetR family n=1 Tax=Clostridium acidisoli DSM 12555 TaxID=1121291 RepID=A0A1W1X0B3_9CLOT|nr:TetR/AcrR family transcriptional regulator [Clostridium acidisoli]SMC16821.1 transcriptional regulator, TetR family [Clostridium acidisoli DSM 12555]
MDKKLGRPRSEKTKTDILTASYDLLIENGFDSVTVEKIAERAGVSKATIYKWWPNKASVVMDGFLNATSVTLPIPDTGSTIDDMFIQVNNFVEFIMSRKGNVITEIIAQGQLDSKLADIYRNAYFKPRRNISKQILERGILRGELRKDLNMELSIDLIWGPVFYRLLITGEVLDDIFVRNLINYAFEGIKLNR